MGQAVLLDRAVAQWLVLTGLQDSVGKAGLHFASASQPLGLGLGLGEQGRALLGGAMPSLFAKKISVSPTSVRAPL